LSAEDYTKGSLWPILVETVHAMVMYPHHKSYVRRVLLKERPEITARDLSMALGIPFGEAIVILQELQSGQPEDKVARV